jgi:hypothetical protein
LCHERICIGNYRGEDRRSGHHWSLRRRRPRSCLQKDPSEWVSGDDPITASQRSYLDTLARQAGEELLADLSKAEASQQIDRLKSQLGIGD